MSNTRFSRFIASIFRLPSHAAIAGGWLILLSSVFRVLLLQGPRVFWYKLARFVTPSCSARDSLAGGLSDLETPTSAVDRKSVRLIAFYLPQFHPIPENDTWWGKGFTEWTNVAKARPSFPGHFQPQLPGELGFYDLRVPEVRQLQADLASEYGIYGFCYYYYWFSGTRLLNRPLDDVLESCSPTKPFCICWANENWTRSWDGGHNQILVEQVYSPSNDELFIRSILQLFSDSRYIRVDGKPLLIVYKAGLLPEPKRTTDLWRSVCLHAGIGEIYLVCIQNLTNNAIPFDPRTIGFDAGMEFPPLGGCVPAVQLPQPLNPSFRGICYDYRETMMNFISVTTPPFPGCRGIMPSWDNTARRQDAAHIFLNSSPTIYQFWLDFLIKWTVRERKGDERLVFINAWNEWAEGNHLEPDELFGRSYLEATLAAIKGTDSSPTA